MTSVGQIEKQAQARVVALFQECLGYDTRWPWTRFDTRVVRGKR
jgi:hypothetical protein